MSDTFDRDRLTKTRMFLAEKMHTAAGPAGGVEVPMCELETIVGLIDSVLQQQNPQLTPAADKSPDDPFASVKPLSFPPGVGGAAKDSDTPTPTTSARGNAAAGNPRGRSQSVSFAPLDSALADVDRNNNKGGAAAGNGRNDTSESPLIGVSRDEFDEIESRFSGMPIASRVRDDITPNEMGGSLSQPPFSIGGNGGSSGALDSNGDDNSGSLNKNLDDVPFGVFGGGGGAPNGSGGNSGENAGVGTSYLSLDPTQSRRKSAVCSVAPSLNLASPRRDGAEHLQPPEEEGELFRSCLAAALQQSPDSDFAPALSRLLDATTATSQPLDVSDPEFEAMSFCTSKCGGSDRAAERCCFIVVALNVLCKYRFMATFKADAARTARFVLAVLETLPSSASNGGDSSTVFFTCPLRSVTGLHTLHLILSDAKLGSQLTDIEIAASVFACLASRAGNVCVTNEFLLRSGHAYSRWFPGWSAQEHVASLFLSEMLLGGAEEGTKPHNPFSAEWWNSTGGADSGEEDPAAATASVESCSQGLIFTELVCDLLLSTDTRHQQWLFRECSELLKRSEASAHSRARRGSIKFGDSAAIIRVADMHRILRCLVHLCEYSYTLQPYEAFRKWLGRWRAETARQGAAEQELALPVSYHCRESTDAEEYHVHFMQIVVAPFTSMLAAVLPHSFTVALLDNTQRLAEQQQLHDMDPHHNSSTSTAVGGTEDSAAASSPRRASAAYGQLLARQPPQVIRNLVQQTHGCSFLASPSASTTTAAAAAAAPPPPGSCDVSPALFAVMRMVENRVRETVGGIAQQQALMLQRAPSDGVEAEAVRMLRRAKPAVFREALRGLDDEELAARFVTIMSQGGASACSFETDDFFALMLRIIRYLNAC